MSKYFGRHCPVDTWKGWSLVPEDLQVRHDQFRADLSKNRTPQRTDAGLGNRTTPQCTDVETADFVMEQASVELTATEECSEDVWAFMKNKQQNIHSRVEEDQSDGIPEQTSQELTDTPAEAFMKNNQQGILDCVENGQIDGVPTNHHLAFRTPTATAFWKSDSNVLKTGIWGATGSPNIIQYEVFRVYWYHLSEYTFCTIQLCQDTYAADGTRTGVKATPVYAKPNLADAPEGTKGTVKFGPTTPSDPDKVWLFVKTSDSGKTSGELSSLTCPPLTISLRKSWRDKDIMDVVLQPAGSTSCLEERNVEILPLVGSVIDKYYAEHQV